MQPNGFRNDPLRNMIVGLTFQQLWYSKLPKEMQWREADQFYTRESNELVAGSEGHGSINSNEAGSAIHCDSDTSVMNDKVENVPPIVAVDADSGLHREISVEVDDMEVEISPPKFETQNFYADSAENSEDEAALSDHGGQMQYAPIFSELGKNKISFILTEVVLAFSNWISLYKEKYGLSLYWSMCIRGNERLL